MQLIDEVSENRQLSRWASLLPRSPEQIGSVHETDAELLALDDERLLALTIDAVVEEIRSGLYRQPATAGRIAVVSALSDLAAVGAEPLGILLAVTLPPDRSEEVQQAVSEGVADACQQARVYVLGGDTNEGPELTIAASAAGVVPRGQVITRLGMRAGDVLFASGPLGSGSALAATRLFDLPQTLFSEGDYRPPTRLIEGQLVRSIASACMDTSDGLLATLDQLMRLNGVRVRTTEPHERLLHPKVEVVRQALGLPPFPFLAGHHGEFELVFSVPPANLTRLRDAAAGIGWTPLEIGRVEDGEGLYLGDRLVDGARLRNLLSNVAGDLQAYLEGLLELGSTQSSD